MQTVQRAGSQAAAATTASGKTTSEVVKAAAAEAFGNAAKVAGMQKCQIADMVVHADFLAAGQSIEGGQGDHKSRVMITQAVLDAGKDAGMSTEKADAADSSFICRKGCRGRGTAAQPHSWASTGRLCLAR
mmetsp:Transcript_66416/g.117448  ORF Transcript_66416/g.117448 Transcript_66416/m.117448 type:complete len:131 (+) Transcript_66416:503-895(+)